MGLEGTIYRGPKATLRAAASPDRVALDATLDAHVGAKERGIAPSSTSPRDV
jgi:hypothetical protein